MLRRYLLDTPGGEAGQADPADDFTVSAEEAALTTKPDPDNL